MRSRPPRSPRLEQLHRDDRDRRPARAGLGRARRHRIDPSLESRVKASHATSAEPGGEGATRHCDLQRPGGKGVGYLEERAFDWGEGEGFRIEITDSNLPFRAAVISFAVESRGASTAVSASPDYELRFGPLGQLLDRIAVRRQYRAGMAQMLAGLKQYVETGVEVDDRWRTPHHADPRAWL